MKPFFPLRRPWPGVLALAFILGACSPTFNWREVRGQDAPFTVLLPDKPATHAREINLDGLRVSMSMTAAEAGGITFAVGSAQLPEAAAVAPALAAMKTALVRNIDGSLLQETALPPGTAGVAGQEIRARGQARNGQPVLLVARFYARGTRVYQALAVGSEKSMAPDAVETFMTSFKLN